MGRPGKEEREQRRARDLLEKALGRRDATNAVTALLKLPTGERGPYLERAASLFRTAACQAQEQGQWSMLAEWATHVADEPQLLQRGAAQEEVRSARWALMWGCGRTCQWNRARQLWATLRGELMPQAPALGQAIDTWMMTGGRLEPEVLAGLPLPKAQADPRLGYDRGQSKPSPLAPPRTLEEVEPFVLACQARQTWPDFAKTVNAWAARATPPLRRAILVLAADLAVRELLRGRAAGRAPSYGCLEQLYGAVAGEGAPPELAEASLLACRLVLAARPAGEIEDRPFVQALVRAAATAARYPAYRPLVIAGLVRLRFRTPVADLLLPLMRQLEEVQTEPGLWLKTLRIWSQTWPGDTRSQSLPEWLVVGLQRQVAAPQALAAWLAVEEPEYRRTTTLLLGACLSCAQGGELVDHLWEHSDEPVRRDLAQMVEQLLAYDMRQVLLEQLGPRRRGRQEELEMLLEMVDMMDGGQELTAAGEALASRLGPRLVPYGPQFLSLALEDAPDEAAARDAVDRYLAARKGVDAWLEAMMYSDITGHPDLYLQIRQRLCEEHAGDSQFLALALEKSLAGNAPADLNRALATALLAAVAAAPGPPSARVAAAVRHARRLVKPAVSPQGLYRAEAGGRQAREGASRPPGDDPEGEETCR